MKTLDQIAEAAGVTRAAIYKRFQSYGLSVNQLHSEKRGRVTVYGENVERLIILMFRNDAEVTKAVDNDENSKDQKIEELQGKIDALQVTIEDLKASKERAEAQADLLLQQNDKLTDTVRAVEAIRAAELTRLQAAQPPAERRGLLARLFGRSKSTSGQEAGNE